MTRNKCQIINYRFENGDKCIHGFLRVLQLRQQRKQLQTTTTTATKITTTIIPKKTNEQTNTSLMCRVF